jgi:hypothetical protein
MGGEQLSMHIDPDRPMIRSCDLLFDPMRKDLQPFQVDPVQLEPEEEVPLIGLGVALEGSHKSPIQEDIVIELPQAIGNRIEVTDDYSAGSLGIAVEAGQNQPHLFSSFLVLHSDRKMDIACSNSPGPRGKGREEAYAKPVSCIKVRQFEAVNL